MQPCPHGRTAAAGAGGGATAGRARAMSSCSCSTASTGTCSAATAARSSTRRTSTASPASGRSVSRPMSPARCPCMPARHDILCGSLDFLWRPWGSIEIWEEPITAAAPPGRCDDHAGVGPPAPLRGRAARTTTPTSAAGTTCAGTRAIPGARTPTRASSARPRCPPAAAGGSGRTGWAGPGAGDRPYDRSRTFFRAEEDFPGPKTMRTAAGWLRDGRARTTRPSCSSSTSSTRTSRSTRPSRGPAATTRTGRASCSSGRPTTSARWRPDG